MAIEDLVALVTLLLGVPAIILQIVREAGRKSPRERLLQDIQIRDAMEKDSSARQVMDDYIHGQAERLTGTDSKRRDPLGIVIGIVLIVLGIGLAVAAFYAQGAWWVLSAPAALAVTLGITGLVQSCPRLERDDKGNPV